MVNFLVALVVGPLVILVTGFSLLALLGLQFKDRAIGILTSFCLGVLTCILLGWGLGRLGLLNPITVFPGVFFGILLGIAWGLRGPQLKALLLGSWEIPWRWCLGLVLGFLIVLVTSLCIWAGLELRGLLLVEYIVLLLLLPWVPRTSFTIWILSLTLLVSVQATTPLVVGSDAQLEYLIAQFSSAGWDPFIPHTYNMSLAITVLPNLLAGFLGVSLLAVLKAFFIVMFSLVPVGVYKLSLRFFTQGVSFLGALLFMGITPYLIEVSTISKQVSAELFLVTMVLLLVNGLTTGRFRWVLYLLLPLGLVVSHYGTTFIFIGLGGFCILFSLVFTRKLFKPLVYLMIGTVLIASLFYVGFGSNSLVRKVSDIVRTEIAPFPGQSDPGIPVTVLSPSVVSSAPTPSNTSGLSLRVNDSALKVAFGLDFLNSDLGGQVFRLLQFLLQGGLVLGCVLLLFYRLRLKELETSFFLGACSLLILVLVSSIVLPYLPTVMGVTRLFQLFLIFLAPLPFLVFVRRGALAFIFLIPYLFFTTGVAYEGLKSTSVKAVSVPYSYSLSSGRVDWGVYFPKEDMEFRNWYEKNPPKGKVYTDFGGWFLFLGSPIAVCCPSKGDTVDSWVYSKTSCIMLPKDVSKVPVDASILLRKYNTDRGVVILFNGIGLREELGIEILEPLLKVRKLVYSSEGVQLYSP